MHPVLTQITLFGVSRPIGTYGLCLTAAIGLGSFLMLRAGRRAELDLGAVIATLALVVASGFIGTTALFIAVEAVRRGWRWALFQQIGMVFFGALFAGAAGLWAGCRLFHLPFGLLADLSVPAVAAAHAIGRLGCFFGGCCYGREWHGPFAVAFTHPLAPAAYPPIMRHPVQLYESACLLVLALAFALIPPKRMGSGSRFSSYVAAYCACRIVLETFRADADRGMVFEGWLTTSQLIGSVYLLIYFGARYGIKSLDFFRRRPSRLPSRFACEYIAGDDDREAR
ncbi:MAG: prolipoprotein diacylglyceryl transferase [Deltaproteobacteria bacterium]|nr:prolipoprotein diacylglyceryl transferase [Deltaproteobacteria bacterium]